MFYLVLVVHLLGAAVWTGGHIVLATTVLPRALKARDPGILLRFEQGYERVGMPALLAQVASGLWLAHAFVPDIGDWLRFSDPASTGIGVKLVLLAITAGFAVNARFRVIPTLSPDTLPLMGWHIRAVTTLSVLFVLTGAFLRTGGF
ncbi:MULTISPECIES: CopD family protein [unclassified Aliiroseovarius]|uniref:CopD family protein n=1 Tax=unclassified Aliiroseovarius TaxID=2623558 RepID=UPI0015683C2D|nr:MULTISPECIES: CopD family protein [unclassified Aliiroseovarius]NRP14117.1 hypothetical protein [Aliiroseovarius sp. xm-d-517]NRP29152.1 hypothetical protein [Aliiroseovarius sp. xm-m-314]NRP40933.1 hypothetical protein [Aliiroseovarius sp. xm-m-339-2]NRP43877.1 hypothetical protein [Aliiroseovarius sp. xm-m-378]NRP48821.1 hypothetical protein [Aliiroseovarius sp. xm-m-354]